MNAMNNKYYDSSRIHHSSNKNSRESTIVKKYDLDTTISNSLRILFQDSNYLPWDPYKIILHCIRIHERSGGILYFYIYVFIY
jgi:hypothetical protein